ncbi:MAG: acetyl-CoA carboxylase biotin carboxylase subunit [Planctomycetota bacterium]|nr:acetyl-CoA carboxylase biotin carboxylase subunit [Planctomycetota bacterium]
MFSRILIANRGEIALRVIRACRELGVETVAVYSEVDEDALYLRHADETICIGPGVASQSYLDIPRIIAAAEIANVDAIHPGYGFLAENPRFAEICRDCKIGFIGPSPETIARMGDKAEARAVALAADVTIVPGSTGIVEDDKEARRIAEEIGYPVIVKAVAGGGGRGMRVANSEIALMAGVNQARAEAAAAFGNGDVYIEKFVERPHHVEVQILADSHGNCVSLGDRECSVQRRHQKLIEESLSPFVTDEVRARMSEAAVRLAKASDYVNAGTVEFLVDRDLNFYFMEMNARIQVEHPVTEMVTGLDLVQEQIRVASGEPLTLSQEDVTLTGHAIECRINAEDPHNGFRPSPGKVGLFVAPGGRGIRVDSHLYSGYKIPPTYDSLVAKIISFADTRQEAIGLMKRALQETIIEGVQTTIPLHLRILEHADFLAGQIDTGFLDTNLIPLLEEER